MPFFTAYSSPVPLCRTRQTYAGACQRLLDSRQWPLRRVQQQQPTSLCLDCPMSSSKSKCSPKLKWPGCIVLAVLLRSSKTCSAGWWFTTLRDTACHLQLCVADPGGITFLSFRLLDLLKDRAGRGLRAALSFAGAGTGGGLGGKHPAGRELSDPCGPASRVPGDPNGDSSQGKGLCRLRTSRTDSGDTRSVRSPGRVWARIRQ